MVVGVGGKGKVVYSNWGVEGGIYNMCMVIIYIYNSYITYIIYRFP